MLRLVLSDPRGRRRFETARDMVVVGRRRGVDLPLGDRGVDRTHCVLRIRDGHVWLVDLGSTSGTFVRGRPVEEASLGVGEEFVIGATRVVLESFQRTAGAAVAAAPALARASTATPGPPARAARVAPVRPAPAARREPEPDFGREVRQMLSKAPWYLTSLVIHILALMLLDFVEFSAREQAAHAKLEAGVAGEAPLPEKFAEVVVPPIEELVPEDFAIEEEALEPEAASEPAAAGIPEWREPPRVPEIGAGTGRFGPRKLLHPLPHKSKLEGAGDAVDKGQLSAEHGGAAEIVKRSVGRGSIPSGLPSDRILIVEGEFDNIEFVLDEYDLRYTLVSRESLMRKNYPRAKLLCINCGKRPGGAEARKLVSRVKSFVLRGGWVITSDWSLQPYLTDAFPDRVRREDPTRRQYRDTTITVEPGPVPSPLLAGVFGRSSSNWWLENTSTFFEVENDLVNVLIVSDDMKRRFGHRVVAFDFTYNNGRVLHLLGHFYQKDGNRQGLVGMHRLIINYLRERFPPRDS